MVDTFLTQSSNVTFCTTSVEEQNKCLALARAAQRDIVTSNINCKQGASKDECMIMLDQGDADLTSLDSGEVFIGGRYHSLIPIVQEVC